MGRRGRGGERGRRREGEGWKREGIFEQLRQFGGAEAAVLDVPSVRSADGAVQVQDHWVVAGERGRKEERREKGVTGSPNDARIPMVRRARGEV